MIQCATLIGFKVAEADPTDAFGVQQAGDGLTEFGKHAFVSGMKQEWLLIAYQEMIKLEVELRFQNRDTKYIGSNFIDLCHSSSPCQ
jgi:hypothetical protein